MQIENSPGNLAPLAMQAGSAANIAKPDNSPALDILVNQNTDVTNAAKTPKITGAKGNSLSNDMLSHLISAAQEVSASDADIDTYNGPLSVGRRHHLEQIASDPAYAKEQARILGTGSELVWVGHELPTAANGYSPEETRRILAENQSSMFQMEQVRGERTAYYERLKEEGMPSAEIFAKLLEFNANLPSSHDDALSWSKSGQKLSYSDFQQAALDYFDNLFT